MPDDASDASPPTTALALLFGSAACVGCLAALAFGSAALLGWSLVPPVLLGTTAETVALSALLLAVFAGLAYRGHRRAQAAQARGETPDPYWAFHPARAAASLVAGALAVAAVALVTKAAIEAATDLTYTIHWIRTVPLLALAFGWVIHGEWNRRLQAAAGEAEDATGS